MRRPVRLTRPFSVLFALWFAAVLGDPGVLHSCPMHGGHRAAVTQDAAHATHDGHAARGDAPARHGSSDGESHHTPGPCTCVGHCCAAPAVAPLSVTPAVYVPVEVLAERDSLQSAPIVPCAAPTRRLPFANGPPAV